MAGVRDVSSPAHMWTWIDRSSRGGAWGARVVVAGNVFSGGKEETCVLGLVHADMPFQRADGRIHQNIAAR
jgi:hypothetical protein